VWKKDIGLFQEIIATASFLAPVTANRRNAWKPDQNWDSLELLQVYKFTTTLTYQYFWHQS
jgi:hypothetical protein